MFRDGFCVFRGTKEVGLLSLALKGGVLGQTFQFRVAASGLHRLPHCLLFATDFVVPIRGQDHAFAHGEAQGGHISRLVSVTL